MSEHALKINQKFPKKITIIEILYNKLPQKKTMIRSSEKKNCVDGRNKNFEDTKVVKKCKLDTKNVLDVDEQSGTSKALVEFKNMTASRDIGDQRNDKSSKKNNVSIDENRYKKKKDGTETTIETREYLCFKNYLWRDYQASAYFNRGMMTQNEFNRYIKHHEQERRARAESKLPITWDDYVFSLSTEEREARGLLAFIPFDETTSRENAVLEYIPPENTGFYNAA